LDELLFAGLGTEKVAVMFDCGAFFDEHVAGRVLTSSVIALELPVGWLAGGFFPWRRHGRPNIDLCSLPNTIHQPDYDAHQYKPLA
jgi:hypothetical protein